MRRARARGFSLIELMVVLGIVMVLMAIGMPSMRNVMDNIRHNNAVAAATSAIRSTRFQAVRFGTTYRIAFNPATATYQVSRIPPGAGPGFVNDGGVMPLGSGPLALDQAVTYQFAPNGIVTTTVGPMNFQVRYGAGVNMKTRTITVTRVGHVTTQ
jgi:prepilin-type N-terminal cleavage/methylation domain-containing protein